MPELNLLNLSDLAARLATQLSTSEAKITASEVQSAIDLLEEGNTLPFIARYRKEATKGLDEQHLRVIEDALVVAKELADRKKTILKTIESQGQLTDALKKQIVDCHDKQQLEDLYLPYKPKRKTRATAAREKGLQPLADLLLAQRRSQDSVEKILQQFVSSEKGVASGQDALAGACDIVAEAWAEQPSLRQWMNERAVRGKVSCKLKRGKKNEAEKFEQWIDHNEPVSRIPSHRFLAMKRGEAEGVLKISVEVEEEYVLPKLEQRLIDNPNFAFADALKATVKDCYKRLLMPASESAMMQQLKQKADEEAISVFASNIRELLLAAPAGPQVTMGIDPGFRTGCKIAVVDGTGRFLENSTIYPVPPKNDVSGAEKTVLALLKKHGCGLIAIGNGTASRETDAFITKLLKAHDLQITKVIVSEAGASVYSASELAGKEYPDLDLTVRGAISIAHRLQDPLSELVKIDPRAIGVGQYQHDVDQTALQKALDREVASCVNSVGVDVNMASPALLSYVAGIGPTIANNIVKHRDTNGEFGTRQQLLKVAKLGPKAFQQAAGFLRIRDGKQALDNSGVHPESYDVVNRIAKAINQPTEELVGNQQAVAAIDRSQFSEDVGQFTLKDILDELASPGRDPRAEFKAVTFSESVHEMSDLQEGMKLEGVITNVTHFGAFVDIGVHQDGLIHISQLADHFVEDPAKEVKCGDIVKVTVMEVDEQRKRISLSRKAQP
ncbi:MAG: Tex family protein [Fuerstiella sp.]